MRSKNLLVCALFLVSIFLFLNFISSADLKCELKESCTDPEGMPYANRIIMSLSSDTNAHGDTKAIYSQHLCCNFDLGDDACKDDDGDEIFENKILGLSDKTNAHAEIPSNTGYEENICFESMTGCESISGGNCGAGETEIISLSAGDNAHLGNDYNNKICCKVMVASWAEDTPEQTVISSTSIIPGQTSVIIIGSNIGDQGSSATVTVYNSDFLLDTEILTYTTAVDEDGNVEYYWTINQDDLDKADGQDSEFYAEIITFDESGNMLTEIKSNVLTITDIGNLEECIDDKINVCGDYKTEQDCRGSPTCPVSYDDSLNCMGINPIPGEEISNCYYYTSCYCSWNSAGGSSGDSANESLGNSTGGFCESASQEILTQSGDGCQNLGIKETTISSEGTVSGDEGDTFAITAEDTITAEETGTYTSDTGGIIIRTDGTNETISSGEEFTLSSGDTFTADGDGTITFLTPSSFITKNGGTFITETSYPKSLGKCSIQETTTDNCDDNFLTYLWDATWDWMENVYSSEGGVPGESGNPIENPPGEWHFPTDKFAKCESKERTIPCPAQIQLPFFTWINFVIALAAIGLIYFLYFYKKNLKHQRKNHKRKKKK